MSTGKEMLLCAALLHSELWNVTREGRTHIVEILCDCVEGSQGHLQSLYSYIYRLNPQSITYIWVDWYFSRWSDFQGRECIFLNTHVFEDVILCHLVNTNRCFGGKSACVLLDPEDGVTRLLWDVNS